MLFSGSKHISGAQCTLLTNQPTNKQTKKKEKIKEVLETGITIIELTLYTETDFKTYMYINTNTYANLH